MGNFDSLDQSTADPENYFAIRLIMTPIWSDRDDGHWFYVEQASFESLEKPYRQRIQHLHRDPESRIRSDVYLLPGDPLIFSGGWKNPDLRFAKISPSDLKLREGCSVFLEKSPRGYHGSTVGDRCMSSLAGASYATSEVQISDNLLISWDRGWNLSGEQVWGATAGGYQFVRKGNLPNE